LTGARGKTKGIWTDGPDADMMGNMENNERILELLERNYQGAQSALHFQNAYELLTATILAAQCTDVRVNMVTKDLFKKYPDAFSLAEAELSELSDIIHSCGFYSTKSKNLKATAKILVEQHDGQVPADMEALTRLPGVGRKTANVVLSNAFGIPGLAVDTHVFRVSNRLGLARANTPEKVEEQLCALIPREKWGEAHHWLIHHGREVCHARKPDCENCVLSGLCPWLAEKEKA